MRPTHLDGILLSQAEMLVLMHAVRPDDLIGIDSDVLIPAAPGVHQALIQSGIQQLVARGLMSIEDEVHVLNPDLLMIARIVAFPKIVTVLLKDVPEAGQQQFTYYQADQFIVEHSMPAANQYRFATLPDVKGQMERMAFILPTQQEPGQPNFDVEVPQDTYFRVREQVLVSAMAAADRELKTLGLAPEMVLALLSAMAKPRFSGTVAYLAAVPPRVVDARNLAVLQGQDSAWTMLPNAAGSLRLRTVTADTLLEHLFEGWRDLVASGIA
jgi:hypothetical protein